MQTTDIPWIPNSIQNPFWMAKERIEVKLKSGDTKIIVCPSCYTKNQKDVTHWRPSPIHAKVKPVNPIQLPVNYENLIRLEWMRSFPWRQRLAILFGAKLLVVVRVVTQFNSGKMAPAFTGLLCQSVDLDRAVAEHRELIDEMDTQIMADRERKK